MEFVEPTVIGRASDLNPKSFPIGSIVYFLGSKPGETRKHIEYGMVLEHYPGDVAVQLYEPLDLRTIEGVPVKEFSTPTEWRKLPKNWSYDMPLIQYGQREVPEEMRMPAHFNDPEWIKGMIDAGFLVPPRENDHAIFQAAVDRRLGWRIVREYMGVKERPDYLMVHFLHCYATYAEAQAELDAIEAECKKQAALSDEEWSIQNIDRTLDRWAYLYAIPDDKKMEVRAHILSQGQVDEIVTRINGGGIEWKYDKNRRWLRIGP